MGRACLFNTAKKKFLHIQSSFASEAAAFISEKGISNRSRRNSSSSNFSKFFKIFHIQNSGFSLKFLLFKDVRDRRSYTQNFFKVQNIIIQAILGRKSMKNLQLPMKNIPCQ